MTPQSLANPAIEFSVLDCGTVVTLFNKAEVMMAGALAEYADLFLDPKYDHDRLAGWLLAKTGITSPLKCQSQRGVGWDITVGGLGAPRMLVMRRHYLYARNDVPHIATQWQRFWNQGTHLREYLKQLNSCIGDPTVLNYYTCDVGPREHSPFGTHGDDMLVIRSPEDTEIRIAANGEVYPTKTKFSPLNARTTTYLC